ncbi:MAG: hypothetical protein ACETWG_08270 [Candidatus Neomarinimicrobiota bacterium]
MIVVILEQVRPGIDVDAVSQCVHHDELVYVAFKNNIVPHNSSDPVYWLLGDKTNR